LWQPPDATEKHRTSNTVADTQWAQWSSSKLRDSAMKISQLASYLIYS